MGAYARALGHYIHNDKSPNCDQLTIGIMGDNRYPQTVGASEYSARFYMEFDFPNFACDDSFVDDSGGTREGAAWEQDVDQQLHSAQPAFCGRCVGGEK